MTIEGQSTAITSPIQFVFDTILKEAKLEDRLVKQLVYTMLSVYTNNPINLAVNSPSGEGKDYVITKVGDMFPNQDVMYLAGMTDKALFHIQGQLVTKNEAGEYEQIEEQIAEIDSEIEDKESEISTTSNNSIKKARRKEIKDLENQKKDLLKDARKLIDLSHKVLVFLDTPRPELFNALMPLLSHDRYDVEYEYADSTNTGIKTRNNVLRGWPAVISAQAIDWSRYARYPEIQRRFIITNPKMTREKYAAAIDLAIDKFGLPDIIYQQLIVSDSDKQRARQIILDVRERMLFLSDRTKPGKNNVYNPFREALKPEMPKDKAFDMTTSNRFGNFLDLSALINIDKRPMITIVFEGDPIIHRIPFALFEDLKESMFLMEYADGIRPYVLEWYYDIFIPAFNYKVEPDFKNLVNPRTGEETKVYEKMIALTTEDLVIKTRDVYNRVYTKHQIRDNFIYPLINQGYIDETESELDKRQKILFPLIVLDKSSKNERLRDSSKSLNLFQQSKILVRNYELYPTKDYIISQIQGILRCVTQTPFCKEIKLVNHDGEQIITIDEDNKYKDIDTYALVQFVDRYYPNSEDYFHFDDNSSADNNNNNNSKNGFEISHFQNTNIASESEQNSDNNVENTTQNSEQSNKLSERQKISQSLSFSCYYCSSFQTNDEGDYQNHVALKHKGKTGYPNKAEIEKLGLKPQGREWES